MMHTPGDPLAHLFAGADPVPGPAGPHGRLGDDLDVVEVRLSGMGEVLICRPRGADTTLVPGSGALAYKTFQRRFFFQHQVRTAFLREVRLWSRLAGVPHIMPVLGFRTVEDRPFVLMPAALGSRRCLRDVLERGRPDPQYGSFLAAQVALGMHLAGERITGLVHGDLKPENVLLFEDDPEAGRAAVAEAVAIRRDLAAADPAAQLSKLGAALNNLGFLSLRMGDLDTARSVLTETVEIRRALCAADRRTHGSQLLRSLNNLVIVLLQLAPAEQDELLAATAEARAMAAALAAADPGATADVVLTLLHFAQARMLVGRESDAAAAAVDSLRSTYRSQVSAMGLQDQVVALSRGRANR